MHVRRKNGKRKTGFKLLLIVVLVMCGVLTYSTGKAKAEEQEKTKQKTATEKALASAKEDQKALEETIAYRQTKQYIEELAREKLGLVKPDEILLREAEDSEKNKK